MNYRFSQVEERLNHNLSLYERQVRNGYQPVHYPTTSLVMGRGKDRLSYGIVNGELRRVCV